MTRVQDSFVVAEAVGRASRRFAREQHVRRFLASHSPPHANPRPDFIGRPTQPDQTPLGLRLLFDMPDGDFIVFEPFEVGGGTGRPAPQKLPLTNARELSDLTGLRYAFG
jgi:hypothetical protein